MPLRSLLACIPLALVVNASQAHACACCAGPAFHTQQATVWRSDNDSLERKDVEGLAFAKEAHLAVGEAEPSDIKGLKAKDSDYDLAVQREGPVWTMTFSSAGQTAGSLTFKGDVRFSRSEVDPQPEPEPSDPQRMVQVHKQWTLLWGDVSGTGMFDLGRPSAAQLILLGRGNACPSASDFTHWILRLTGAAHDIRFFGKLKPSGP